MRILDNQDIKYAIRQMARLGLSHCVVLQGRDLVGLVTLRDLTLRYVEEVAAAKDKP
jgi:CBS domain-containing protein